MHISQYEAFLAIKHTQPEEILPEETVTWPYKEMVSPGAFLFRI